MKRNNKVTDPGKRGQLKFADNAAVDRVAESGLDLSPIGAIGLAQRVESGSPVMVFNSAASIAYVAFGDQNVAAPSSPANGIPLLPNEKLMLNSGSSEWIRASAATVFAYVGDADQE